MPESLYNFGLNTPFEFRFLGGILIIISNMFILRVNFSIDRNFSTTLMVHEDHKLVKEGPFKYIRHPMYSGIIIWMIGLILITDNALFIAYLLGFIILIMGFRMVKEERMLI